MLRTMLTCAGAALIAADRAAATSAEELEALREEIRQERQALADERVELARQRERVDEALSQLDEARAPVRWPTARRRAAA